MNVSKTFSFPLEVQTIFLDLHIKRFTNKGIFRLKPIHHQFLTSVLKKTSTLKQARAKTDPELWNFWNDEDTVMLSQFIGIQASEGTLSQSRLHLLSTSPNQELLITFTISVPSEVRKKHIALSSPTKRQNYIYFQTTEVWWKAWLCSEHTV